MPRLRSRLRLLAAAFVLALGAGAAAPAVAAVCVELLCEATETVTPPPCHPAEPEDEAPTPVHEALCCPLTGLDVEAVSAPDDLRHAAIALAREALAEDLPPAPRFGAATAEAKPPPGLPEMGLPVLHRALLI